MLVTSPAFAQTFHRNVTDSASHRADTTIKVSFGAFVDAYYAYDFGRPKSLDRLFTTQAARHNEFNISLAYVEAKIESVRIHGRIALQAGTAVQSNYAGEPRVGAVSGPDVSRFIQEAVAGFAITPRVRIDAGIFFSWIGMESFISRDNLTYTRSLSADFTPYYASGVRAVWQVSPVLGATFAVVNGWQNVSETNQDKAVGVRLDYAISPATTLCYYDFFGNELDSRRLRTLNGVGIKSNPTKTTSIQANFDYGTQEKTNNAGRSSWHSEGLIGRWRASSRVAMSARGELYHDPDQVLVVTGSRAGFNVSMVSVGVDATPSEIAGIVWRNEIRATWADSTIFADRSERSGRSKQNCVLASALVLTL